MDLMCTFIGNIQLVRFYFSWSPMAQYDDVWTLTFNCNCFLTEPLWVDSEFFNEQRPLAFGTQNFPSFQGPTHFGIQQKQTTCINLPLFLQEKSENVQKVSRYQSSMWSCPASKNHTFEKRNRDVLSCWNLKRKVGNFARGNLLWSY